MGKQVKQYIQYTVIILILVFVYMGSFTYSAANKISSDLKRDQESFTVDKKETETKISVENEYRYVKINENNTNLIKQELKTSQYVLTPQRVSVLNKNPIGYTYLEVKFTHLDEEQITARDIATYIEENKLKVVASSVLQSGIILNFLIYYIILMGLLYVLLKVIFLVVPKIRIRIMHGNNTSKMMEAASRYLLKKGLNVSVIIFYTNLIVGLLSLQGVAIGFNILWKVQVCLLYTLSIILIVIFEVYRIDRKSKKIEE